MSVLSTPVLLAWSTPLSSTVPSAQSTSSGTASWARRRKGRLSTMSRPESAEDRQGFASNSSSSASSCSTVTSTDEPLTPPPDSPSLLLTSARSRSSFASPTTFLELALDSSDTLATTLPGRKARSLSPPRRASSSCPPAWSGGDGNASSLKVEGQRRTAVMDTEGGRRTRTRASLPEGWEHIPWVTSSEEEDELAAEEVVNWRTTTVEAGSRAGGKTLLDGRGTKRGDEECPPSPPRTPSPRFRAEHILDAASQPTPPPPPLSRTSDEPTRRRSLTRYNLPTLRDQLPPSPPRSTSSPRTKSKSRSLPTSPTKPRYEIVDNSAEVASEREGAAPELRRRVEKGAERRRKKSVRGRQQGRMRSGGEEQSPPTHDEPIAVAASEQSERWIEPTTQECAPGLGLVFAPSSTAAVANRRTSSTTSLPALSPCCSCDSSESDEPNVDDGDDARQHFEAHFQSLPLLRLRNALSLAATFAALPPTSSLSTGSNRSRSGSSSPRRYTSTPALSSASRPRPSPSYPATHAFTRNPIISEQYRLYAMGRAKAERTGGVGYWEGGRDVWAGVLAD